MSECPHAADLCKQTWPGDAPKCAFTAVDGLFSEKNWNCGVVNRIRDLVYEGQEEMRAEVDYQYCDDNKYATVNVDAVADLGASALWVGWYKNRGATMAMWLLDHYDAPRKPTRDELLTIVRHFEQEP